MHISLVPFRLMSYTENGLSERLVYCIDQAARSSCRNSKIELFESLDQYIEEYSGFSHLVLANFRFIFLYYILYCSLAFVAFGVHHLVKFVSKRAILLRSLARDYWAQLASGPRKLVVVLSSPLFSKWMKTKEFINGLNASNLTLKSRN